MLHNETQTESLLGPDETFRHRAAMFAHLGGKTRISKNGYAVIFSAPSRGRHDLSSDPVMAAAQLRSAGIDLDAVTDAQMAECESWERSVHEQRRISQARIIVTHTFLMPQGHELVPVNGVLLVDGWGMNVARGNIVRLSYYDASVKNRIGGMGAYCTRADRDAIEHKIEQMRREHPDLDGASVQDNDSSAHCA